MKKSEKYILYGLVVALLSFMLYTRFSIPRIAYVRSAVIVEQYKGMIDARSLYQEKVNDWKNKLDTLKYIYRKTKSKYALLKDNLTHEEIELEEERLNELYNDIMHYTNAINDKSSKENERLTQGALNQINSFIEQYAERKGYDLILGITLSGNILYGNEKMDITDKVLKELNDNYQGNE